MSLEPLVTSVSYNVRDAYTGKVERVTVPPTLKLVWMRNGEEQGDFLVGLDPNDISTLNDAINASVQDALSSHSDTTTVGQVLLLPTTTSQGDLLALDGTSYPVAAHPTLDSSFFTVGEVDPTEKTILDLADTVPHESLMWFVRVSHVSLSRIITNTALDGFR